MDCELLGLGIGSLRVDVRERAAERQQSPLVRHNNIAQISRVLVPEAAKKKLSLKLPSGDQSAVEPPGPIPNPEVKRRSANGSETIGLVRVGRRQVYARLQAIGAGLFFADEGSESNGIVCEMVRALGALPASSANLNWG